MNIMTEALTSARAEPALYLVRNLGACLPSASNRLILYGGPRG